MAWRHYRVKGVDATALSEVCMMNKVQPFCYSYTEDRPKGGPPLFFGFFFSGLPMAPKELMHPMPRRRAVQSAGWKLCPRVRSYGIRQDISLFDLSLSL